MFNKLIFEKVLLCEIDNKRMRYKLKIIYFFTFTSTLYHCYKVVDIVVEVGHCWMQCQCTYLYI